MVKTLPSIDWDLGFPQAQRIAISTAGVLKAYDFVWRWNEADANNPLLTCKITRAEDSAVMWTGAVHKNNALEVRDPTTYEVQFTFMARELDKALKLLEVWVFEE